LRTWPGSMVNAHVARFVVWGAQAHYLISQQPWSYAFGHGSALERFAAIGGRILLLGSDHDTVTFLHYAEHVTPFPGKRIARYRVPVDEQGVRVWREMEEYDTADAGAHANWPPRFFARVVDTYLNRTGNTGARVGDALSFLLDARGLLEFAQGVMKAVAADHSAVSTVARRDLRRRRRRWSATRSRCGPLSARR